MNAVRYTALQCFVVFLVSEDGQVFTWGVGILGKGPVHTRCSVPQLIPPRLFGANDYNPRMRVKEIHAGLEHFAALNGARCFVLAKCSPIK